MQTNIHLPGAGEKLPPQLSPYQAFKHDAGDEFATLDIADGYGGRIVVFIETVEQAQELVEAAVTLRMKLRDRRTDQVIADLTVVS